MTRNADWAGWRSAGISVAVALGLRAAARALLQRGRRKTAGPMGRGASSALSALAVSGWVAFTLVPALARRTPLRWLAYRMDYRLTREGMVYLAGIFIVALAAVSTPGQ